MNLLSSNTPYYEFDEKNEDGRRMGGRTLGPDGNALFHIDGPHSAPTQHLTQYNEVMICSTGIGITPLAATLKSVVHHIWPMSSGNVIYPGRAHFYWVCSYYDVPSFKWFLRTVREACDAYEHMRSTGSLGGKVLDIKIYLTSYARAIKAGKIREDDLLIPDGKDEEADVMFWGKPRQEEKGVQHGHCSFRDDDLWRAMTRPEPNADGKGYKVKKLGPVTITVDYPKWPQEFDAVATAAAEVNRGSEHQIRKVGVMFCGNPAVGKDLKNCSAVYTKQARDHPDRQRPQFRLHKEVF
jgi:hypothetical protein